MDVGLKALEITVLIACRDARRGEASAGGGFRSTIARNYLTHTFPFYRLPAGAATNRTSLVSAGHGRLSG
jgi:hypothetical protein